MKTVVDVPKLPMMVHSLTLHKMKVALKMSKTRVLLKLSNKLRNRLKNQKLKVLKMTSKSKPKAKNLQNTTFQTVALLLLWKNAKLRQLLKASTWSPHLNHFWKEKCSFSKWIRMTNTMKMWLHTRIILYVKEFQLKFSKQMQKISRKNLWTTKIARKLRSTVWK